jgi:UDP-glucose 4-epimerase
LRVLVTGSGGFVGAHLTAAAVAAGHAVTALFRRPGAAPPATIPGASVEYGDLSDRDATSARFQALRPEAVLHAAARIPTRAGEDAYRFFDDNVRATINLLHAAKEAAVDHVVFSSSMSVYGNPSYLPVDEKHPTVPASAYGVSKLEGEMYARLYAEDGGFRATVLRYSGVFGPGQKSGAIPTFIARCARDEPLTLHAGGRPSSDYVWVRDVARANLLALARSTGDPFAVYNIGGGAEVTVAELAELIRELSGSRSEIHKSDGASARDFRFAYDVSQAREGIGFVATGMAESVGEWVREVGARQEARAPGFPRR